MPAPRCDTAAETHRPSPPATTITEEPRLIAATQPRGSPTGPGSTSTSIETSFGMVTVDEAPIAADASVAEEPSVQRRPEPRAAGESPSPARASVNVMSMSRWSGVR